MLLNPTQHAEHLRSFMRRLSNYPEQERSRLFFEEIGRLFDEAVERVGSYRYGRDLREAANGTPFNVLSLGTWNEIANEAGVARIPALYLGSISPLTLLKIANNPEICDDADWEAVGDVSRTLTGIVGDQPNERFMVRADCSAAAATKLAVQSGEGVAAEALGYHRREDGICFPMLQDMRLLTQAMEWPGEEIALWARPWIEPATQSAASQSAASQPDVQIRQTVGIPREWRVFIEKGEIVAISNYYPQIERDWSQETQQTVSRVLERSDRMLETLKKRGYEPHHPRYHQQVEPGDIWASFDFLEADDGHLLFLEGGPGHMRNPPWGAHPCCFSTKQAPRGLALKRDTPSGRIPLNEIRTALPSGNRTRSVSRQAQGALEP